MKKNAVIIYCYLLFIFCTCANAAENKESFEDAYLFATCQDIAGYSYHMPEMVPEKDRLSSFIFYFLIANDGKVRVVREDIKTKKMLPLTDDGATITCSIDKSQKNIIFIVNYPEHAVVETFMLSDYSDGGRLYYTMTRGTYNAFLRKMMVMEGQCTYFKKP